jgi:NAD(P)-dependent dehydrogenase (short-subunit alcohol dehydrogenase family)
MAITIDLSGRVALVTGGSRGLGAAICRRLAQAGADVAVHYATGAERAGAVAADVERTGRRTVLVGGDFHDPGAVTQVMAAAQRALGPISILVNNVGREEALGPALELEWDAYQEMFELNVRSALLASRAVFPGMRAQKWGRIVNVLSVVIHTQPKGMAAYTTAKTAFAGFTRCLAVELGAYGVTVNSVSPGWIPVERHGPGTLPGRLLAARRTPLGHLGKAQDVADTVTFLASDLAAFITGVEIPVCGGVPLVG